MHIDQRHGEQLTCDESMQVLSTAPPPGLSPQLTCDESLPKQPLATKGGT